MKIMYLADTDTALIKFSGAAVDETKEVSEDIYLDMDNKGNLVSMTVEHARKKANISEVSFLQIEKVVA